MSVGKSPPKTPLPHAQHFECMPSRRSHPQRVGNTPNASDTPPPHRPYPLRFQRTPVTSDAPLAPRIHPQHLQRPRTHSHTLTAPPFPWTMRIHDTSNTLPSCWPHPHCKNRADFFGVRSVIRVEACGRRGKESGGDLLMGSWLWVEWGGLVVLGGISTE